MSLDDILFVLVLVVGCFVKWFFSVPKKVETRSPPTVYYRTPDIEDCYKTPTKGKIDKVATEIDLQNTEQMTSDMNSMLEKGILSDVTLQCGSENFKAHRSVLSARSPVFDTMFKNPMKENKENMIDMKEMEHEVVQAMLEYIYTGKVKVLTTSIACELMAVSDMYQLQGLKTSCSHYLKSVISEDNALKICTVANLYDEILKLHAVQFICYKFDHFANSSDWRTLQNENPSLAMELMDAKINFMKLFGR